MKNKYKLFSISFILLSTHFLFAYNNTNAKQTIYNNMIIPVPTYIPNSIENKQDTKIILKNLKTQSPYSYTIYKLYINKCQKKDINKKNINIKVFYNFLNSKAYKTTNRWYIYQKCSLNPHINVICKYVVKIKNKPKIKCFKPFNF